MKDKIKKIENIQLHLDEMERLIKKMFLVAKSSHYHNLHSLFWLVLQYLWLSQDKLLELKWKIQTETKKKKK